MGVEALPRTITWACPTEGGHAEDFANEGAGSADVLRLVASGVVRLVDQRALPGRLAYWDARTVDELVDAIQCLAVRGAPALGLAGAWGVVLAAREAARNAADAAEFLRLLGAASRRLASARPTAVNLSWGVRQAIAAVRRAFERAGVSPGALALLDASKADEAGLRAAMDVSSDAASACERPKSTVAGFAAVVQRAAFERAQELERQDEADNRAIGAHGAALLPDGARVLTHCNAGSLACGFYGTALGVVYAAFEQGKLAHVYADETRPVGQGARLTMWELSRAGVPCTLECDGMAASLMAAGKVDAVVVGADRIAANGDVANKVGTYQLAIAAAYHGVPFYVAAPSSTVDAAVADGAGIPIEFRDAREVLEAYGMAGGADERADAAGDRAGATETPADGAKGAGSADAASDRTGATGAPVFDVYNPAFDVTPACLVTAIVTERGVFAPADISRAL